MIDKPYRRIAKNALQLISEYKSRRWPATATSFNFRVEMKIFLLIALSVAAVLALAEEINPSIVGGINALPNEFPYIVSIQYVLGTGSAHVCGGAIINHYWILSVSCIFVIQHRR